MKFEFRKINQQIIKELGFNPAPFYPDFKFNVKNIENISCVAYNLSAFIYVLARAFELKNPSQQLEEPDMIILAFLFSVMLKSINPDLVDLTNYVDGLLVGVNEKFNTNFNRKEILSYLQGFVELLNLQKLNIQDSVFVEYACMFFLSAFDPNNRDITEIIDKIKA